MTTERPAIRPRRIAAVTLTGFAAGLAQFWLITRFLELEVDLRRTIAIAIGLLCLVGGSTQIAFFWAIAGDDRRVKWLWTMRACMAICAGAVLLLWAAGRETLQLAAAAAMVFFLVISLSFRISAKR